MSIPGRQFHVRLTPELTKKLDELEAEFAGLPRPTLMKLLISSALDCPLDVRIERINHEIRKKPSHQPKNRSDLNLNAKKRLDG